MREFFSLVWSSVGQKYLMAITGLAWIGFAVGHLLGNLALFAGGEAFNKYAHFLQGLGVLLYVAEGGLVILLLTHVVSALRVTLTNWGARDKAYLIQDDAGGPSRKTLSSRTMIYTGIVIFVFIVVHVWMFKYGAYYSTHVQGVEMRDLYRLVVERFKNPWISGGYVAVMLFLGFHLRHAFWSAFQSLGLNHPRWSGAIYALGVVLAIGLALGFVVLPIWVYLKRGRRMKFDAKIPAGPLAEKWQRHKNAIKLVSPANKRKYDILVVGTGLAGASAAASLAEMGYNVKSFCIQDSPRRAHSVAAQGGINASKNYQNDGDSVWRLFYDTIKGGDFRSREANVYRLAELSGAIIDQCVAQGVPFAREYGGTLANRSFGGAQVSRTFYARGATGQQLLYGAYGALMRQVDEGRVKIYPHREMLGLVLADGKARGIVCRNLFTGEYESYAGHAVLLCTGGYSTVFYLSTNAVNSNATALWRCHKKGAMFANPCYTQIHPTCLPVAGAGQSKLTLMSESLRNDGRVWVPKKKGDTRPPDQIPEEERDYFLERKYPAFGNLVPRDIASRNAQEVCDEGRGVGVTGYAVYLDFAEAIGRLGEQVIRERYGNLFDMYEEITAENPYRVPMRIYPAPHYTMGGLWVDYNLMSTIPGLFVLGEANFSDHGANRLGASALMQGLCDGYFVIPYTLGDYLAQGALNKVTPEHPAFGEETGRVRERNDRMLSIGGKRTAQEIHRDLGALMIREVGMSRNEPGLKRAIEAIRGLREEFWKNVRIPSNPATLNKHLEIAGRVSDYLELAELMAMDALARNESCGGHFRIESQTPEGEARRDDENQTHVSVWEYRGDGIAPEMHKEALTFEAVHPSQRSYK